MTRLLGIDLGTRRIGLAVADTAGHAAPGGTAHIRPLATLRRSSAERDATVIADIVREQHIDEVVVGLPLNMDGSEGEMAIAAREWADATLCALGLPLAWRDERLTSEQAAGRLRPPRRGRSGGPPSAWQRAAHRAALDREAAVIILQAEMDARKVAAS